MDYEVYKKLKKYEEHFNKTVACAPRDELQEGYGRATNEPVKKSSFKEKQAVEAVNNIDYSIAKYVPKKYIYIFIYIVNSFD